MAQTSQFVLSVVGLITASALRRERNAQRVAVILIHLYENYRSAKDRDYLGRH
jgi:hypothetical protein